MSSNTFGKLFAVTTFGESHGPAIGCVIDGCPPGLPIDASEFADDLARRATGRSRHTSQRREADEVEILSGVYEGKTTGTPIALLIRNTDAKSKDYDNLLETFRPGHADYTYWQKYGIRDPRGGGRSSARETTMRVAAAVIAKKWLRERHGIVVRGHLAQIGKITPSAFDWDAVEQNPFFWPDASMVDELEAYMDALRKSGDSVGARVDVCAENVPPGPRRADLRKARRRPRGRAHEHQRGEGGRRRRRVRRRRAERHRASRRDDAARLREQPRRRHPRRHLDRADRARVDRAEADLEPAPARARHRPRRKSGRGRHQRRHDPCVGIRATPIAEAMVALVLIDHVLRHRAQCGDVGTMKPRITESG
jgi:chorismate synthase